MPDTATLPPVTKSGASLPAELLITPMAKANAVKVTPGHGVAAGTPPARCWMRYRATRIPACSAGCFQNLRRCRSRTPSSRR